LAQAEALFHRAVSAAEGTRGLPSVLAQRGGFLWRVAGQVEEAGLLFAAAAGHPSAPAFVFAERASWLSKVRGDERGAEAEYLRGLSLDPTHAQLLGNYARLLVRQGDTSKAATLYEQALASSPDHAPTLLSFALLLKV
jgi:tetratricopeptide (TPR) repeat protein